MNTSITDKISKNTPSGFSLETSGLAEPDLTERRGYESSHSVRSAAPYGNVRPGLPDLTERRGYESSHSVRSAAPLETSAEQDFRFPYFQYMYSYPHKTAYRKLPDLRITDYLDIESQTTYSLYIHIPFCESKCGYCNLFSVTGQTETVMSQYLAAIERQFTQYQLLSKGSLSFDSLIIGGGTPLLLSCRQLEHLFSLGKQLPAAIETSPRQTTEEKLAVLKQHGVSRISIGVQSFHDEELSLLNRQHTVTECRHALSLIRDAGFTCRNLDLIYGIPGQTKSSLRFSLEEALSYTPEELFLYPLYIKPGTGLFAKKMQISEQAYSLYLFAGSFLKEHGYRQISMRRFIKIPQTASRSPEALTSQTALRSCGFEEMLSLGCGGRSYLKNLHFCTPYHIRQSYCLKEIQNFLQQENFEKISFGYLLNGDEMLRRFVIKNLLHTDGFSIEDYQNAKQTCALYGYQNFQENKKIWEDFPVMEYLRKEHLLSVEQQKICLTEKGLSYSDWIGTLFLSKDVLNKMEEWKDLPG